MRYSKRFKRLLFILAILSICILSFFIISKNKEDGIVVPQSKHSTNNSLTNAMSDLEQTKNFDKTVERFLKKWALKGISIAVMKNNKLVYAKGYGYSDVEKNKKMDVSNILRVASASKLITAVAIMKLIDEEKITLKSKVFGDEGILKNRYEDKNIADKRVYNITIEHLLRHSAGLTAPAGDPMFKPSLVSSFLKKDSPVVADDIIEYVLSRKLGYSPGNSKKYSNTGYLILSEVIEEVAGSYEDYITEKVLAPAGCKDIHIAENYYYRRYRNEVRYYSTSKDDFCEGIDGSGDIFPKMYGGNDIKGLKGAGAWVASPVELLKFITAIDGKDDRKDIISKSAVSTLTTQVRGKMPIGWMRVESSGRRDRTGSFSGTSAVIQQMPNGISWVAVSNTSSWIGYRLNNHIITMMRSAISTVNKWPDRDLFDMEYVKKLSENTKKKD